MSTPHAPSGDLYVYDGECALCSGFVQFLVQHDDQRRFALVTGQSPLGRVLYEAEGLCPDAMETALLRVGGRTYRNLDVFTETLVALGWPWKAALLLRLLPTAASDRLYRLIADNRRRFQHGCPVPSREVRARLLE